MRKIAGSRWSFAPSIPAPVSSRDSPFSPSSVSWPRSKTSRLVKWPLLVIGANGVAAWLPHLLATPFLADHRSRLDFLGLSVGHFATSAVTFVVVSLLPHVHHAGIGLSGTSRIPICARRAIFNEFFMLWLGPGRAVLHIGRIHHSRRWRMATSFA